MFVLVVGAGRVGSSVATSALRAGHTVSVHSPDDSIEIRVTAGGEITGVHIRGSLQHRSAAELAREVQAVVTTASEAARWARQKLHDEVFGEFRSLGER